MYGYYESDYDKKKPYLLKMMEVCDSKEAKKWYNECKAVLNSEDFAQESQKLHDLLKNKNIHDYLQLRIDEGCLEEVLGYLQAHPAKKDNYFGIDYNHNLSKQLIKAYPEEICKMYWIECESLCVTSNKKNYQQAVSILKEIKDIGKKKGMGDAWETNYAQFKEKHKRKSLLMGYINADKHL